MTPLDGIRVVDVTEGAQGPYAASLLGDLGAEVIKIERPGGEMMRRSGPFVGGLALPCLTICHARAATVVLDFKAAADMAVVHALVEGADIFMQNWKIGTDRRLGLDFESCRARNPAIIYLRSSGFGARGPYAEEGSMDMLSQAACGMASLSGAPDGLGERTRTPVLDFVSAFSASEAVMIGLAERERTGQAQFVDCSQLAAGLDMLGPELALANSQPVPPAGSQSRHYGVGGFYETSDGEWIAVECVTEAQEQALARIVGEALEQAIRSLTLDELMARLATESIPHARVDRFLTGETIDKRPGNLQRYIDPVAGELRYPDTPWVFSETPLRAGPPLGRMGRDNAALPSILQRWRQAKRPV